MAGKLGAIGNDPDILIRGDKELSKMFLNMTREFFKATKQNEFIDGSGGDLDYLDISEDAGQWIIWEQIRRQNEAVLAAAATVNFDDDAEDMDVEEEEEEEEAHEEVFDEQYEEPPQPQEEYSDMADEKETPGIDQLHISDMEDDEEEEYGDVEDEDGGDREKFERMLIGDDSDAEGAGKGVTARDWWGDMDEDYSTMDARSREKHQIEQSLIQKKGWEMSGETLASERPKDGLIDIDVDFDFSSSLPPDPLSTSELERLLIARIESAKFDDVQRIQKPKQSATEAYAISGERSKLSLTELYEQDYTNQRDAGAAADSTSFTEAQRTAWDYFNIFDEHCNRLTEKRSMGRRPRGKIDVQKGAMLDVEDRPEAVKAPEEIMAPAGSTRQMKGDAEVTSAEKKGMRRRHKEKDMKEREAKDAAKGILYSSIGKDGSEVKAQQDVKKLLAGNLQGVETVAPGEAITFEKKKPKVNKNFMK